MPNGYKLSKIYVGANQVRPTSRTFTISWTEKSDMSSGWTYSDDAAGLTAGSSAFDEFFGYSAVRLSTAGLETNSITQTQSGGAGKLDITQLGTLTSGDNVMIKFPLRGIKMTKSGSVVTLSITDNPNADGYQYYAHCLGTISNPGTPNSAFYLGAYKNYNSSNVLKSWSGQTPTASITQSNSCSYAKANGSGYNIMGFYQRMYINALYMMKYGNPNSQSVIGNGYTGQSNPTNTGGTNSQTNATYGSSNSQIKLFGLEDWRGNLSERIGGVGAYNKVIYTALNGRNGSVTTSTPYESTGTTMVGGHNEMQAIAGTNNAMFISTGAVSNTNYNTYYSDEVHTATSSRVGFAGGNYGDNTNAGIFCLYMSYTPTSASFVVGSRLMYMDGLA